MKCPVCGHEMEECHEQVDLYDPEEKTDLVGFICRNSSHSHYNGEDWEGEVWIPANDCPDVYYSNGQAFEVSS